MKKLIVLIAFFATHYVSYTQELETKPDSIIKIDTLSIVNGFDSFEPKENAMDLISVPFYWDASDLYSDSLFIQPDFRLNYLLPRSNYYSVENLTVSPIRFGFDNGFEGGDLLGVNNHFKLTDFLSGDLNFTFSSSFLGPSYPQRYNNASISLGATWHLSDRIRVNTFGQYSLREGINPALSPMINGGNYYGGEIQVKIVKNLGIGVGFVNSYYRKNWTLQPTARPVSFE
jgi:hypothetical protein